MAAGTLTLSQTQEAATPRGNLEKSWEEGGGGKKILRSGNSTHLNIMFIYSTTKEQNIHWQSLRVCVCINGQVNMPLQVTNCCLRAQFLTQRSERPHAELKISGFTYITCETYTYTMLLVFTKQHVSAVQIQVTSQYVTVEMKVF